ncbi:MAG: tRNA 2-selenouridine(34) synthase MnmH [Flavobacteriales bacterium]
MQALSIAEFLAPDTPVIDVRSPGEFERGHIPGAHPLPLFSDAERAIIGTLYKQQGRDAAVLEGLRIVGPKLAAIVEQARALAFDGRIRVHCWRGGERSGSVAWLLGKAGFPAVHTLRGGYKAFRAHVLRELERPPDLCVLGGYTGTGKTAVLGHLQRSGEQVIDLEALARHKGSAFGAIAGTPQPTTEHFENLLWQAIRGLDPQRHVWIEDESPMIGHVRVPNSLIVRMRRSPLYFAEMPAAERVERLMQDYGQVPSEVLAENVLRIQKRLGPQHAKAALEALAAGDLRTVASIALRYYDKAYLRGLAERDPATIITMPASAGDLRGLALRLEQHAASSIRS